MKKNKLLSNNFPLKVLSVAVGILVWLLVVNVDNPTMTRTLTLPLSRIEIANEAYIDSNGMMYTLDDSQTSFKVSITGGRKTVEKINTANLVATADLQQAVSLETDPVMVPVSVACEGVSSSNLDIEVTPKNLSVIVEEKKTQEFVVTVTRGETKPAKGYEVGELSSNPEKVKITGPTSLINKIDKVSAYISVDNITEDVSKEVELSIVDKNGEQLNSTQLSYLNVPKVTVSAKLWKVVTVNVNAGYFGSPASGYYVENVETIPNSISVTGSEEALSKLEFVNGRRTISAGNIDISGKTEDYEEKINMSQMLPEGISLVSDASADVWVRISILPDGSTAYDIPTKNILVESVPEGMQVTFETDKIEVRVKKAEGLEALETEDIAAAIVWEDMEAGTYEVPVTITLPDGYELVQSVTAEIEVSKVQTAESDKKQED